MAITDLMINEQIRDKEIRLIDENGEQLGIMSSRDAQKIADERKLDLVKIAPTAKPPVCRIMDYGKYKFDQAKKEKEARKKQKTVDVKELRLSPSIDTHDVQVKVKKANEFLKNGDKVKVSIRFRGREIGHSKAGMLILENFAKERNIKYVRDKMHNIVLFKEATEGYEDHETVMLEGHMDMVCEKNNDSDHDFSKDPIELIEEDGFLHANKTTLGADDGVGVCYMLALLDDESLKHPALECVFTVQEEVGLNGAMGLDKSILKAKKMIGLDRGKEKIITVSCSGGRRAVVEKELSYLKNESPCYQLYVGGLQGGHSGGVIHLERGNANVIMTRVYYHLSLNNIEFLLGSFKGGLKDNAIPRECVSVFASNDDFKKIKEVVLKVENDLKEELKESDKHIFVRLEKVDSLNEVISVKESQDIISMMYLMPNGFMHKSLKMDLTNISLNMGVVEMNEKFNIYFSIRSPMESAKDELSNKLSLIASMFKAKYILDNNYPGWNYDEGSQLRKQYVDFVKETEGITLKEEGTHSGLETGIFKGALQDLDIITLGPDMFDIHTPDERLNMNSFYKCYQRLIHFLERL